VDGRFDDVSVTTSKRMSAIKVRGNRTTERQLRLALVSAGIKGWQVKPKGLIGNPDFYFPDKNWRYLLLAALGSVALDAATYLRRTILSGQLKYSAINKGTLKRR
jgi:hypothetical protein